MKMQLSRNFFNKHQDLSLSSDEFEEDTKDDLHRSCSRKAYHFQSQKLLKIFCNHQEAVGAKQYSFKKYQSE